MSEKNYVNPAFTFSEVEAIQDLYQDSCVFNTIAGGDLKITPNDFLDQFKLIKEEFKELEVGIENRDPVEQLDGCIDILVTVFGYMQKMRNAYGIDIGKAMQLVAENNLSKFPVSELLARHTVDMYKEQGIETNYSFNKDYEVYVIRDSKTNKVKKPIGFNSVDLEQTFPSLH